ncbi:MAG: response regulator [Candidatus Omnitrophica bacterium]|nr:response regulator [Candidatus Omnitrophota bacterium]
MDKKKILIIDDEADLTRLIKLNLEGTGKYTVRAENNGLHGLIAAKEFNPNIIFLDIMMPDVDGGDICCQLENDSKTKDIPVVFLTGVAKQSEIKEGMGTIGGHSFLAKPVSLRSLIDCIEKTSKA